VNNFFKNVLYLFDFIEDKLIKYRLHPKQETGGKKSEMQKYIEMNWELLNNQIQDMKEENLNVSCILCYVSNDL
jgi:hypothetical protein